MIESSRFRKSYYLPALVLGALLLAAASGACGDGTSTPNTITIVPPADDVLTVGIVVDEMQVLNGFIYGDEHADIVILSHMRPNDQSAWFSFAETVADHGYAVLTFDFRGYGISPGDKDFGMDSTQDLLQIG